MFTDYTFTIITTISELNEIADALNNRRIQWDRLESKLMICNREKCNCFSNEEMGFSLETKYGGVMEEVENMSRLFPTAIIKCEDRFEDRGIPDQVYWYLNGADCYRKSDAGKEREIAYLPEAERFISMDTNQSSGIRHRVELSPDGTVKAEGDNLFGECDVSGWTEIQAVSCGNWHTVGLRKDGTLVACGSNVNGQCNVSDIAGKVSAVSCGRYHTAILLENGRVIIKGYLEEEVKNCKPLSPDHLPEMCKLNLSKTVKGWEKMNKLIEDISSGDELKIKPVIKDGGIVSFEVCNSGGKKIGTLSGVLREHYEDLAKMLNGIKAYAEDVVPLSQKGPRAKYATMNIRLEYVGDKESVNMGGKYQQTPVETWPAVRTIRSVLDAVIGVGEDGQILISGFCPFTETEIQMLIKNELSEYLEKKNAIVPVNQTEIGDLEFSHCNRLRTVVIPEGVTRIGRMAFYDCKYLESVVIPEGVTSIGDSAFYDCKHLESVVIPEGITSIGDRAFHNCEKLKSVTIPDTVTSIEDSAFEGCTSLTSVVIPDCVTSIEDSAFEGCTSLTSVVIPDCVTSIGNRAFAETPFFENDDREFIIYGKTLMKYRGTQSTAAIPEGVTRIGSYAFSNCDSLTEIIIPAGVINIGSGAFIYCNHLTDIVIPEGVTSIGSSAFKACDSLTSVTLPDSLNEIGFCAFSKCKGLADENGFVIIRNVLYGYFGDDNSVVIPDGVEIIEFMAFDNCECLTSVILPESVTDIGNYAFEKCSSLTSVTIPDSVTSIGNYAFSGCENLTYVTIPESITDTGRGIFWNCNKLKCLTISGYTVDGTQVDWRKTELSEIRSMLKSKDYSVKM